MHTIRLRDPWQCEYSGEAYRWIRHFNRPTGLSSGSVVELHIDRLHAGGVVMVNGRGVGCSGIENETHIFSLDAELPSRNELVIVLPGKEENAVPSQPFEEVRLLLG